VSRGYFVANERIVVHITPSPSPRSKSRAIYKYRVHEGVDGRYWWRQAGTNTVIEHPKFLMMLMIDVYIRAIGS